MADINDRSIKVLGSEKISLFKSKTILIAGLGGVGGTALEALARSGFSKFLLIDFDLVDESNLNRQILYTSFDIGKPKIEAAKNRILSINSNVEIETLQIKIDENSFEDFAWKIDFIVDAIDFVPGKIAIYKFAIENNIPFISSLGMGNRINPSDVILTKLNKTEGDPLARRIRYEAKKCGLDLNKINVVFSKEIPLIKNEKPGSLIMVPSEAGLLITKFIIENTL